MDFLNPIRKLWSTPAQRVAVALEECILPAWTDTYLLTRRLEELAKDGALDAPGSAAALAAWCDVALVNQRLRERTPKQVVEGAALLLTDPEALRPPVRAPLRAVFERALLLEPSLLDAVPEAAKAMAAELLRQAGHGLPAADGWSSPWESLPKKRTARLEPPALAPWTERFAVDDPTLVLAVPDAQQQDALLERDWQPRNGRYNPWQLNAIGDTTALRLWNALQPGTLWVWGEELAPLVQRFGLRGLEVSLMLVREFPATLAALATLDSPRAATLMATGLAGRPALRLVARAWFDRFPEAGAVGLVPAALGADRAEAHRAAEGLRHLRRVHPEAVARGLGRYEPACREGIDELLTRGAELPARRPLLPEFAEPAGLPRPVTPGGAALQGEPFADLLRLLKLTPLDGAPWMAPIRAAFTPASLTRLARALFDAWIGNGAPPKEKWAMQALAHFPDDEIARELAGTAAEIAPKGLSARAQEMTEVLAAMQTRVSLMLVHQLSRKVKSKAFRARAELVFTTAAEKMGLTEDELAERLVPDFGLTPEGVLPVEPKLRLMVDGLKPRFVDEAGKTVKTLPAVADEELSTQLKELKKRVAPLLREISERLERRMANGRRMSAEHFTEVYVMNGLARPIAERLVWGAYGAQLETAFALTERGLADAAGATFVPPEGKTIGIVHPLELPLTAREAWAKRLGKQPFDQLIRRALGLTTVEGLRAAVRPYLGITVESTSLLKLEKLGWRRGEPVGGGCYVSVSRALPTGVVEVTFAPGIYLGDPKLHSHQRIDVVELGLRDPTPAQQLSEIEHDLHDALRATASATSA